MRSKLFVICALLLSLLIMASCSVPIKLSLKEHAEHYRPRQDEANNGLIFIYRESEFIASARGIYIQVNGVRVGGLNNGTYFVYSATPGDATVVVENNLNRGAASRMLAVETGKKYYLRGGFKSGFLDVQPYIEIVPDVEGEQAIRALQYATLE